VTHLQKHLITVAGTAKDLNLFPYYPILNGTKCCFICYWKNNKKKDERT